MDPATLAIVVGADQRHRRRRGRARSATRRTRARAAPTIASATRVCDTCGACGTALVTVTITVRTSRRPRAATATTIDAGTTLDVAAPGLLAQRQRSRRGRPDPGAGSAPACPRATCCCAPTARSATRRPSGSRASTASRTSSSTAPGSRRRRSRSRSTSSRPARSPSTTRTRPRSDNPLTVHAAPACSRNDRDAHSTAPLTARLDRDAVPRHRRLQPGRLVRLHAGPGLRRHRHVPLRRGRRPRASRRHSAVVTINVTAPDRPRTDRHVRDARRRQPRHGADRGHGQHRAAGRRDDRELDRHGAQRRSRHAGRARDGQRAAAGDARDVRPDAADQRRVPDPDHGRVVGRRHWRPARSSVFVSGDMKLGDYQTTYLDMETSIAGFPVQVLRTYDTNDTRLGDFGVGWRARAVGPARDAEQSTRPGRMVHRAVRLPVHPIPLQDDHAALRHGDLAGWARRGVRPRARLPPARCSR